MTLFPPIFFFLSKFRWLTFLTCMISNIVSLLSFYHFPKKNYLPKKKTKNKSLWMVGYQKHLGNEKRRCNVCYWGTQSSGPVTKLHLQLNDRTMKIVLEHACWILFSNNFLQFLILHLFQLIFLSKQSVADLERFAIGHQIFP